MTMETQRTRPEERVFRFRPGPRSEPPVSREDYLEGPPPCPERSKDSE